jgi:hypothetical protein
MNENFKRIAGHFQVYLVRDGKWELMQEQCNMTTYSGADLLGKALAGQLSANTIYIVFENDPSAVRISPDVENDAATYAAASANRSFVRVSTMGSPTFTASGSEYDSNKVTFLGVTDGSSFFEAIPVTDGTSVFYHAALVASPDADDQTQDVVFSCGDLTTDLTKVAGAQIGIRWDITFTTPTP